MKKKVINLFSIITLLVSSLLVMWSVGNVYAYEPDDQVDSYWLINEGVPYESDVVAGTTSGYGRFSLGEENIILTTNANEGYFLDGWQIVYTDNPENVTYVDSEDLSVDGSGVGSKTIQLGELENAVDVILEYRDTDNDGYYDNGTFNISKVSENLQVVAVYDYIYYNVDVSALFNLTTINAYSSEQIAGTDNTIYYNSKVEEGSITTYSDALISFNSADESDIFYYGDLYLENGSYYTLNALMDGSGISQKIDYSLGAYRLSDNIVTSFEIDIDDLDLDNSVNIDVIGATVSTDSSVLDLTLDAESEAYSISQDEYLRTTQIDFDFTITNSLNQVLTLDVEYHNLYVARIEAYLDNELAQEEGINSVLSVTTATFYYSQISTGAYFIKNSNDNNGNSFRIVCAPLISSVVDAKRYDYYQFNTIDNAQISSMSYPNVDNNFTIRINYNSINYYVNFEFRLYNRTTGSLSNPEGNFNLEQTISLTRGDNVTIDKTAISDNIGYAFYGFAFSEFQIQENTSIDVQIDYNKPENLTILMLFTYVDYSINLVNFDSINLNDGRTDYYPISRSDLTVSRGTSFESSTLLAEDLRNNVEKNISFDITANIGDSITLSSEVINGFRLLGYKFDEVGDYITSTNTNSISFVLTSDLISQYANLNDEIEIYVYEDYITYTLTYYIEASTDSYLDAQTIMADLTYVTNSQNVTINEDADSYEIVISDLKLYEVVTLNAKGKTMTSQEPQQEYTYMFVRFTENDRTNLSYTYSSSNDTYTHVETISRDISIKVVYTMPSARLQISTDRANAYDLDNLVIYQNGSPLEKNDNSVIVEAGQNIQVVLNPNSEQASDIIAFGYRLVGYTFTSEGQDFIFQSNELTFSYTVTSSNIQYLTINFEEIEYHVAVLQSGGGVGYNGEYVTFEDNNYKVITVEDRSLTFDMPVGYYVARAYVYSTSNDYTSMNQSNDYQDSVFNYEFEIDELSNLITNYGVDYNNYTTINFIVQYQIHTYSINIEFELTNPKNNNYDNYVQFPGMTIQYTYQGLPQTFTGVIENNEIVFENIPYNSNVVISVTGSIQSGLSAYGWTNDVNEIPEYTHSNTSLTIPGIVHNEYFKYKLSYDSYTINVIVDDANRGNPTVMVNNVVADQISLFDNLKIQMNAIKDNGFRFENMYYYVYTYQTYVYTEESWNSNYMNLYTYSNTNGYTLNTSNEYNPAITYYEYVLTQVDYNESTIYEDPMFNVSNYYLVGGVISFYIEYDYLEISLINDSSNYSNVTLVRGDINITPDQYSTYQIIVTTNGEEHELTEGETVNYLDSIDIYISLNTITFISSQTQTSETYDLSDGVYLAEIYMLNRLYTFEVLQQDGQYKFSFNISDIISSIPDNGELTIYYRYLVGEKQITLTTNIDDPTFYRFNNRTRFEMWYDNTEFGFDAQIYSSGGQPSLNNTLQFLGKTRIGYNFYTVDNVDYSTLFYIAEFKIYNQLGELLVDSQTATRADYDRYGISVVRNSDNYIQSIDIRFIDNLIFELQVQPVIIYNGAELVNNTWVFRSEFICDSSGNGIAQYLTIGDTSEYNIQMAAFILNYLLVDGGEGYNVAYYDINGMITNPTNVGTYEVRLQFNDTGDLAWLSSIDLEYEISFVITAKPITVSYQMDETFSKTYDGSSNYDASRLLQYLVFGDGVISIDYIDGDFSLTQNYVASITSTINSIETPIATANENTYYNITLSNINLAYSSFNNNFVLNNSSVTFYNCMRIMRRQLTIQGVAVNDKVYDGTVDVTIRQDANIRLQGALIEDDVNLVVDSLNLTFSDPEIGAQKQVTVDSSRALIGADAQNYVINTSTISASIYPYSVTTHVEGVGDITITNRRGLTQPDLANLIPIGANLRVDIIQSDTNEYVNIYDRIVRYLSNNNVFTIGYVLRFEVNGVSRNVDSNLYLTVPNEDRLTGAIWLTGDQTGELNYEVQGDNISIDLSQIGANVNTIIITEQRLLLELWQIILIVIGAVLLIAIIIIIFLVIRKKKKERYSVNDTI